MSVNPIDYTTIANGTIHLNGSKGSSSASKTDDKEEKKTKNSSNAENDFISTNFSDDSDEMLASLSKKSNELMSAIASLLKIGISSPAASSAGKVSSAGSAIVSGITGIAGNIADKLNSKFKGALAGKGAIIAGAAQKYGIEPELLAAIMALETGWGTSSAVNNQKNPGGLMDPSSNWMSLQNFATIEQGIEAMAKNLKTGYLDKGLTSIATIGNKYCPVGAANDPNGTNGGWIPSVTSIYNQLKA